MTERKRTYQLKTQVATVRRLTPITTPTRQDDEAELARQGSLTPAQGDQQIDLLNRLIKHLKTL